MKKIAVGKLFMNGRSQAVRLPKEFRMPGDKVRLRRVGTGVLIEPMEFDVKAWFDRLHRAFPPDFMEDGRNQPPMPPPRDIFD
jgi:antitoxin VapB